MGSADKPSSLTPTEAWALENEGAKPGGEPLYDRFRQQMAAANGGANDAVSKFEAWRDANPVANWASKAPMALGGPMTAASGMLRGAIAAGQEAGAPPPQHITAGGEPPQAPAPPIPAGYDGGPPLPTAGVGQLPDAPKPGYGQGYKMSPSADPYEGYGTDKGVLHSQLDTYADMGGLQDKKSEEYQAHLASMKTAADMEHEVAQQQQVGALAYQNAVAVEDRRQADQEDKIQKANDDAASNGVDPGRYFKNRDAGFWLTMMVGSIAGGILSAVPGNGGKNAFIEQVNQTVGRDIHAQETAIEQGWKKVKGTETAYERMRMSGVDKVTATLKQQDLTLAALQTDIKGRLMKSQIPEEQARLEGALQSLQIERDKNMTTIQETWRATRESRARAAATSAMAGHAAERQARLDADEHALKMSQVDKNKAEAAKTGAEAKTKPLSEADKAAVESGAGIRGIDQAMSNVKTITDSGPVGTFAAKTLPSGVPGVTGATNRMNDREEYNRRVLLNVAAAYKLSTDSPELKRLDFIEHFIHPYEITPSDNAEVALHKMQGLKKLLSDSAEARGVPAAPSAAGLGSVPSFKPRAP